uniref:Uncharacterized protein n=2 Tax=Gouania willdenowi TaxID=441366 RepID=A0A8C5DL80_GOUWI
MSDLGQPSSSHSSTVLVSGMKRDRGAFLETSNLCKGSDWERGNFAEPERTRFEKPTSIDSAFLHMDAAPKEENAEEYQSPQRKRRLFDSQNLHSVQQPWSQDPLLTWSQFSESDQKHAITEPRSPNTLQSEEAFGNLMDEKGRTSTQKSLKLSQSSHTDKENITSVSLYSPRKHSFSNVRHISLHKDVNPRLLSPQKERNQSLKDLVNRKGSGSESQIIWTKPHSPLKTAALAAQQQSKGLEDESFSALFTQDSQGLRVIAHRDVEGRSPLRDQGNIFTGVVKSYNSVDDDEEEDGMLFTQDSQGNVVIKH